MRVLALTRYGPLAASSRIRCYQYLDRLRQTGIEVKTAELLGDEYVHGLSAGRRVAWWTLAQWYLRRLGELLRSGQYDLLWIAHEVFPGLPATAERLLARIGPPYIVESDDAVFHRYDLQRRSLGRLCLGRKIDVVMAHAAMVIAGNDYLAERARSAGARRVTIVPSVVDLVRYPRRPTGSGAFTIGWIGSPTTANYLKQISSVLRSQRERGARLVAIGAGSSAGDLGFEYRRWAEATEAADIAAFDVGIMPLSDGPWERGKCGYKIIQYMASARPVVASPVGANRSIVDHGVTGFLAETDAEWAAALSALAASPDLRRRMGEAGRRVVAERYCLDVTAPTLARLLREAARVGS